MDKSERKLGGKAPGGPVQGRTPAPDDGRVGEPAALSRAACGQSDGCQSGAGTADRTAGYSGGDAAVIRARACHPLRCRSKSAGFHDVAAVHDNGHPFARISLTPQRV